MAKQMSYTDQGTGAVYPSSYWTVHTVHLDLDNVTASITMHGHVDAVSFQATRTPIATKSFILMGDAYTALLATAAASTDPVAPSVTPVVVKDELLAILNQAISTYPDMIAFFTGATDVA